MKIRNLLQFPTPDIAWKPLVEMLVVCLLLPPVISLPYAVTQFLHRRADNRSCAVLFAVFASYMAVINASKFPGGDQANYWAVYMKVPEQGFWWAVNHIYGYHDSTNGKEFMNGIYNYVGYYITGGCYPLYIWLNTIAVYLPFYYGIKKMFERRRNAKWAILAGVLCLSFYTQFFNLTIHLQRQVLAYAIVMGLYYLKASTGKINLWGVAIAVFTHTTTIFFLPFLFLDLFYKRIGVKRLLLIGELLLAVLFVVGRITSAAEVTREESNALTYSISRVQSMEAADDGGRLNLPMFLLFNIPLLCITILNITRRGLSRYEYITYNSYIVLFLFVLSMSGSPLVQYRYAFFTYGYIGLILPVFLCGRDSGLYRFYAAAISLFFIARFYMTFAQITWRYDPPWKSLAFPELFNILFVWYGDISRYL